MYSWAMGVVRTVILADFAAGEQGLFEQLVEVECLFGRELTLLEGMGAAGTLRNPTNVMSEGAKRALPRERQGSNVVRVSLTVNDSLCREGVTVKRACGGLALTSELQSNAFVRFIGALL